MVVQHNLTALNTSRMLNVTTGRKAKSSEKLSSGYRINRAADDAAGLSISEKMRKQSRGLERGVENTLDGISLCQVMDGALNEVTIMVQRVSELSIQAANGTNSDSDRQAIQAEVDQILQEIDRIGETTRFNQLYPFKVDESRLKEVQSVPSAGQTAGSIPFKDFKLSDVDLNMHPFTENRDGNYLALQAVVDNDASAFDGKTYNMIYGNGGTSYSSFKLNYNGQGVLVNMEDYQKPDSFNIAGGTWTRTFKYLNEDVDVDITQNVTVVEDPDNPDAEKYYAIEYSFKNNTPDTPISLEFMFHADTAYNDNDLCEGYFIEGNRIQNNCVYTTPGAGLTDGQTDTYIYEDADVPNSFSVVDVDNALAFSEKISFPGNGSSRPKAVSFGQYSAICNWGYYDHLNANLGGNTYREDLGFSLYYTGEIGTAQNSADGEMVTFTFNYGIVATEADLNLKDVVTKKDENTVPVDSSLMIEGDLWIQSGAETMDGIILKKRPMNTNVLKLADVDLSTEKGADAGIEATKVALRYVSEYRSLIGAQQNRLEHTVANEENIIENTTAAESRIRDTDMAEEMVQLSMTNILAQAGQAMLAQANSSTEGVLSLLK